MLNFPFWSLESKFQLGVKRLESLAWSFRPSQDYFSDGAKQMFVSPKRETIFQTLGGACLLARMHACLSVIGSTDRHSVLRVLCTMRLRKKKKDFCVFKSPDFKDWHRAQISLIIVLSTHISYILSTKTISFQQNTCLVH